MAAERSFGWVAFLVYSLYVFFSLSLSIKISFHFIHINNRVFFCVFVLRIGARIHISHINFTEIENRVVAAVNNIGKKVLTEAYLSVCPSFYLFVIATQVSFG